MITSLDAMRDELARQRNTPISERLSDQVGNLPEYYDPTVVVDIAPKVLKHSSVPLIERYVIIEQLIVAAIDCGSYSIAETYVARLEMDFEDSSRVNKLKGHLLEAQGQVKEAQLIYNRILDKDPANLQIRKRLIMSLISSDSRIEAIKMLVKHVDLFMQDIESWYVLADLYLQENMYAQAAFCFEELMMMRPDSPLYALKYAEICAALSKFSMALKYYCLVIETLPDNLRAWYGIYEMTKVMASGVTKQDNDVEFAEREKLQKLFEIAKQQIRKIYSQNDNETVLENFNAWFEVAQVNSCE
jgi:tetratricopeptide (TPR) repeat protein